MPLYENIVNIIVSDDKSTSHQKSTSTQDTNKKQDKDNDNGNGNKLNCDNYYLYDNKIQLHNNQNKFEKLNEISMDKINVDSIVQNITTDSLNIETIIYCIIITPYISLPDRFLNLNTVVSFP